MVTIRIPTIALCALALHWAPTSVSSFIPSAQPGWTVTRHRPQEKFSSLVVLFSSTYRRKRSTVTDEDGPTPDFEEGEYEEVDPDDIPELREIERASDMPPGPIPHQPWRRGDTNGCEDPITADWRIQAEDIMTQAVTLVGGKVVDITWFLTAVLVTLDHDLSGAHNPLKSSGPVIEIKLPGDPLYYDPNDPKPEDVLTDVSDEDAVVYQRETEEEAQERKDKKRNTYAKPDEDDPEDEPHIPEGEDDTDTVPLYMNEETRDETAYTEAKEAKDLYDEIDKPPKGVNVDNQALSTIAGAILEALEDVERELRILSRHELVLSSPGPPDMLETQKQFDAHRGMPVIVETQDPWKSNRVLKGKLLDRNSMDVLINKQGRMVTIPLNFVKCVRVEPPQEMPEDDFDAEED